MDCSALKGEKQILLDRIDALQRETDEASAKVLSLTEEIVELTSNGTSHQKQIAEIDEKHRVAMKEMKDRLDKERADAEKRLKKRIKEVREPSLLRLLLTLS